jgi:hypothetical protein
MVFNTGGSAFEAYGEVAAQVFADKADIVLYGFGVTARRLLPIVESLGFKVKAILDRNPALSVGGVPWRSHYPE